MDQSNLIRQFTGLPPNFAKITQLPLTPFTELPPTLYLDKYLSKPLEPGFILKP
jgi:hypothetical protein